MERGVGGQPHKTPHFNSGHRHTHTRNDPPKKSLGPAWPPRHRCWTLPLLLVQTEHGLLCGLMSVAQKNKPSTMLSSNVQSIDLHTDCMAWRFWTNRQPNGCSTPAPKSSAAKQWIKELAQTKEAPACGLTHGCLTMFWGSKGCEHSTSLSFYSCVSMSMGCESSIHSACSMLLRMLLEQQWILQCVVTTKDLSLMVWQTLCWNGSDVVLKLVMIIFICATL